MTPAVVVIMWWTYYRTCWMQAIKWPKQPSSQERVDAVIARAMARMAALGRSHIYMTRSELQR